MRSGIILAISVSLVLVGGASWSRLSSSKSTQNLAVVEQKQAADTIQLQEAFAGYQNSTSTAASAEPLTSTDLIGRQLMMDYFSLASSGQDTDANIQALASQYVESIPTLATASTIGYRNIKTVIDNAVNFQTYSNGLGKIYAKYAQRINKTDDEETNFAFAEDAGRAYQEKAQELLNLATPVELASAHVRLINANLAMASALKAISETEIDPAKSLAGVITMNQKMEEGISILREIARIISEYNGI